MHSAEFTILEAQLCHSPGRSAHLKGSSCKFCTFALTAESLRNMIAGVRDCSSLRNYQPCHAVFCSLCLALEFSKPSKPSAAA